MARRNRNNIDWRDCQRGGLVVRLIRSKDTNGIFLSTYRPLLGVSSSMTHHKTKTAEVETAPASAVISRPLCVTLSFSLNCQLPARIDTAGRAVPESSRELPRDRSRERFIVLILSVQRNKCRLNNHRTRSMDRNVVYLPVS